MHDEWTKEELEEEVIGKMRAVTIAVNHVIEGKQKVMCLDELEKILRSAEIISQGTCECRARFKKCVEPMDGCLGLNDWARASIGRGDREVSVEEALASMKRTHEAGLVHMAYSKVGEKGICQICSCCSCCCHTLGPVRKMGYTDQLFESAYIVALDSEKCRNCGACVNACHFEARRMEDGMLSVDLAKCFGCGVCESRCPEGAITMVKRSI